MKLSDFTWQRAQNGCVDFLDVFYAGGIFPKRGELCMFSNNKHELAMNLRACFGLTLHKSTKLAERILKGENTK
tara:strand:- start:511 stop:732 length:222 start_codon:yes stop_codon:yes gene_type:complete